MISAEREPRGQAVGEPVPWKRMHTISLVLIALAVGACDVIGGQDSGVLTRSAVDDLDLPVHQISAERIAASPLLTLAPQARCAFGFDTAVEGRVDDVVLLSAERIAALQGGRLTIIDCEGVERPVPVPLLDCGGGCRFVDIDGDTLVLLLGEKEIMRAAPTGVIGDRVEISGRPLGFFSGGSALVGRGSTKPRRLDAARQLISYEFGIIREGAAPQGRAGYKVFYKEDLEGTDNVGAVPPNLKRTSAVVAGDMAWLVLDGGAAALGVDADGRPRRWLQWEAANSIPTAPELDAFWTAVERYTERRLSDEAAVKARLAELREAGLETPARIVDDLRTGSDGSLWFQLRTVFEANHTSTWLGLTPEGDVVGRIVVGGGAYVKAIGPNHVLITTRGQPLLYDLIAMTEDAH